MVIKSLDNKIKQLKALCEDDRFGRCVVPRHHWTSQCLLTLISTFVLRLLVSFRNQTWEERIKDLEHQSQIRDKGLLWDCIAVMAVVVVFFFIHSSVPSIHINLGWIAILGEDRVRRAGIGVFDCN